jgi:uncharacterized protein (UPF0264 family)
VSEYALSVKQPWATLLVHGLKTIEVRRWPTARRGRVWIHAAALPDERPDVWQQLPASLVAEAREQCGGLIGSAALVDCKVYRTTKLFCADRALHHNRPDWFRPPLMYGFVFADPQRTRFQPCSGQVRFFRLDRPSPADAVEQAPGLLVSVRDASEAVAALAGGAALIDVKEPQRGALGRADDAVIAAVADAVARRRPVSAALGELRQAVGVGLPSAADRLQFVKWGPSGYRGHTLAWEMELNAVVARLKRTQPGCAFVAVAYADWQRSGAPPPPDICAYAGNHGAGAVLIDTWHKDGTNLLDWLDPEALGRLAADCLAAGVPLALAGSLGAEQIRRLLPIAPAWFAVRSAACKGGRRQGPVRTDRVRQLVGLLTSRRQTVAATSAD